MNPRVTLPFGTIIFGFLSHSCYINKVSQSVSLYVCTKIISYLFFFLFALGRRSLCHYSIVYGSSTFIFPLRDTSYAPTLVLRETIENRNILHGRTKAYTKIFLTVRRQLFVSFPSRTTEPLATSIVAQLKIHTK